MRLISKTEEVVEKELLLQVPFPFSVLIEQAYFFKTIMSSTVFLELDIWQRCMPHF